jgi:hypothetical protein
MPDTSLNNAVKASAASTDIRYAYLKALEITHPAGGPFYLVSNNEALTLTHEDGTSHNYEAVAFNLQRPKQGETGTQVLKVSIANADQRITDFIKTVNDSQLETVLKAREYLSNDLTTPARTNPIELTITKISLSVTSATATATFVDVLNRPSPNELFTRNRFGGLGG